mmetsp:Transcript_2285/g.6091  ORF Transcript_2285/g.6091 Transcript_2285/m.6091 type:complete len:107 (+) Transcript_2285:247-567(+)
MLEWQRDNGLQWDAGTCTGAAAGGHLPVLQMLRAQGCPWDENVCMWAAAYGKYSVLQWAHANGCPLGSLTIADARQYRGSKGVSVADFEAVVKWLRANGCPEGGDD